MKRVALTLIAVAASLVAATGSADAQTRLVARGQYIVDAVAGCNDCHSPRDRKGQLIPGRELTGAALAFAPVAPMPWEAKAPPIRGLPKGWTEVQFSSFLQTGVRPNGSQALPPMPAYRMDAGDAKAVAAYVHALR